MNIIKNVKSFGIGFANPQECAAGLFSASRPLRRLLRHLPTRGEESNALFLFHFLLPIHGEVAGRSP